MNNTVVMVLAGGEGERLYPLTRDRAKPAVPFAGNLRLVDFTLSNCLNSGLRRVNVLTQYKSDSLNRHIRLGWDIFNPELGEYIEVRPPQLRLASTWYLGTADAIYQNIYTLQREMPEYVLILSGDHVYSMDYSQMIGRHINSKAVCTIACKPVPLQEAHRFGILTVNNDERVINFAEKPDNPRKSELPSRFDLSERDFALCSMGVYVFNTEALVRMVIEDSKNNSSSHDFGRDVFPAIIQSDERVTAYPFWNLEKGKIMYWRDIGTLDAYMQSNLELATGHLSDGLTEPFSLYDRGWPFRSYVPSAPPLNVCGRVDEEEGGANRINNSLISNGVVINNATVLNSVIGPQVIINEGAFLKNSVVLSNVKIGENAVVANTIVDKHNVIPSGTQIGIDKEADSHHFTVSEGGIVVVPKRMPLFQ